MPGDRGSMWRLSPDSVVENVELAAEQVGVGLPRL